jgi:hypothetical protein
MSEFRDRLKSLDGDALADIATDLAREQARRAQKSPSEMSPWEFEKWSADQIRQAEAARKAAEDE